MTLEGTKSHTLIYTKREQAKASLRSAMQQNEGQEMT